MECPVVKIEADNEQGFIIINESDFDAEKHVLFGAAAPVAQPAAKPEKEKAAAPAQPAATVKPSWEQ